MKKISRKIVGASLLIIGLMLALVTTASAATVGDPYSLGGVHIGYIFIGIGILVGIGAIIVFSVVKKGKALKAGAPVVVIAIAFMLIGGFAFTDVTAEPADISAVTWEVTAASDAADLTINNEARTITKLIWADVDLAVINATDDSIWVDVTDDIWVNFTISPSLVVGISETTNQATTTCSVLTPDQSFTEDSTEYDLFQDAATGGDKDLEWTTDGTTAYESKLCTVTIGGSETASLHATLLDDGLSQYEAGENQAFQVSVGGITYTVTVIVTGLT